MDGILIFVSIGGVISIVGDIDFLSSFFKELGLNSFFFKGIGFNSSFLEKTGFVLLFQDFLI